MSSENTKLAVIIGVLVLVVVVIVGGLGMFVVKMRAQAAQQKALADLKERNPVEYYVLHTPPAQNADDTRNAMLGTWQLGAVRNRTTGQMVVMLPRAGNFKTWTLTNWSIASFDTSSNLQYTASGHYTLQGDLYTEAIEEATGQMRQYLGNHPAFHIRVVDDTYYQMSADNKANPLEEMWFRVN